MLWNHGLMKKKPLTYRLARHHLKPHYRKPLAGLQTLWNDTSRLFSGGTEHKDLEADVDQDQPLM